MIEVFFSLSLSKISNSCLPACLLASINSPKFIFSDGGGRSSSGDRLDAGGQGGMGQWRRERRRGEEKSGEEQHFKRSRAEECVM